MYIIQSFPTVIYQQSKYSTVLSVQCNGQMDRCSGQRLNEKKMHLRVLVIRACTVNRKWQTILEKDDPLDQRLEQLQNWAQDRCQEAHCLADADPQNSH